MIDSPDERLTRARAWVAECEASVTTGAQLVAETKGTEVAKLGAVVDAAAAEESAMTFAALDAAQQAHNVARNYHALARRVREKAEHAQRRHIADLEAAKKAVISAADAVMVAGQPARIAKLKRLIADLLEACSECAGDVPAEINRPINFALLTKGELRIFEFLTIPVEQLLHVAISDINAIGQPLSLYERRRRELITGRPVNDSIDWEKALHTPVSELSKAADFGVKGAAELGSA